MVVLVLYENYICCLLFITKISISSSEKDAMLEGFVSVFLGIYVTFPHMHEIYCVWTICVLVVFFDKTKLKEKIISRTLKEGCFLYKKNNFVKLDIG